MAINMMPKLEKIVSSLDINIMAAIPLVAADHEVAMIIYYFDDLENLGQIC